MEKYKTVINEMNIDDILHTAFEVDDKIIVVESGEFVDSARLYICENLDEYCDFFRLDVDDFLY